MSMKRSIYNIFLIVLASMTVHTNLSAESIKILVLGETSAGKTTLIQGIFNSLNGTEYADLKFLCKCNRPQTHLPYPPEGDNRCPHRLAGAEECEKSIIKQIHADGELNNQRISQTGAIVRYKFTGKNQQTYEIIDTPGFAANPQNANGNVDEDIRAAIEEFLAEEAVHYIVIAMNSAVERGASVNRCISEFNSFFGEINRENLERHTVLVGTHRENEEDEIEAWKSTIEGMEIFEDMDRASITCAESKYLFFPRFRTGDDIEDFEYEQRRNTRKYRAFREALSSVLSVPTMPVSSEEFALRKQNREQEEQLKEINQRNLRNALTDYRNKLGQLTGALEKHGNYKTSKNNKTSERTQCNTEKSTAEQQVDKQCTHRFACIKLKSDHFQETVPCEFKPKMKTCDRCSGSGEAEINTVVYRHCSRKGGHDIWHRCRGCGHKGPGNGILRPVRTKVNGQCPTCSGNKEIESSEQEPSAYKDLYSEKSHDNFPCNPNGHSQIMPNGRIKLKPNACLPDCPECEDGIKEEELGSYIYCNSEGNIGGHWAYLLDKNSDNCSYCNQKIKTNSQSLEFDIFNDTVTHRLTRDSQKATEMGTKITNLTNEINQLNENLNGEQNSINRLQGELNTIRTTIYALLSFYAQNSLDGSERPKWEDVLTREQLQLILSENLQN